MSTRFKLTFPQELIREPIIFNMAKKYDLMPNIRRARITESVGEMILELEGPQCIGFVVLGSGWIEEEGGEPDE